MMDSNTTTNNEDTNDDNSIFGNLPVNKVTPAGNRFYQRHRFWHNQQTR